MSGQLIRTGLHFSGANAANVEVGFIPDIVKLYKLSATPSINIWIRMKVAAFTSGGTHVIKDGDIIQGATSVLVRARVRWVQVTSGTWKAGTAAGNLYWYEKDQTGTFGAENVDLLDTSSTETGGGGVQTANVATIAAQAEKFNYALNFGGAAGIETALVQVTPANGVQPYVGTSAATSEGFTITDTLATAGDIWFWEAIRGTDTL